MSQAILERLQASRAALLDVIAGLSDDALDRRPASGWSIREVLTHLLSAEQDHCRVIALVAQGEAHRLPAHLDLDAHNARRLAEQGRLTRAGLVEALTDQRRRTGELLDSLSAEQLAWVAPHPVLGEKTLGDLFRIIALHERGHTREIAAILAAP